MEPNHPTLGRFLNVHKPGVYHLILWPLLGAGPFFIVLISTLIFANDVSQGAKVWDALGTAFPCAGVGAFLFLVAAAVWTSDFRAWLRTRHIRVYLYTNGFSYQDGEKSESCEWNDMEHFRYRVVPTYSRAFPGSSIKVLKAIVKKNGKTIIFAETLPLTKITDHISKAYGAKLW